MKNTCFTLIAVLLLFSSCKKTEVYRKFNDDFVENRWENNAVQSFDFSIEDDKQLYDVVLNFSHVYDYQFESIPLTVSIFNPKGEEEKLSFDLKIKDENGKELADCGGDFCDLKYKIKGKTILQKGNYKINISHNFKGPYLPNVLGVGLEIEKTK